MAQDRGGEFDKFQSAIAEFQNLIEPLGDDLLLAGRLQRIDALGLDKVDRHPFPAQCGDHFVDMNRLAVAGPRPVMIKDPQTRALSRIGCLLIYSAAMAGALTARPRATKRRAGSGA